MALPLTEKLKLKRFIQELASHKAAHTEFISVYIPKNYDLIKIIQHLSQEQGTAANIKSASTRKNVIAALERMIHHLRAIGRTPSNGLAVFSGNVASKEGKQDLRIWSTVPPLPLNTRIYRCDKSFVTDILEEMIIEKEVYGLVVFDRRDGMIALLKGKTIVPLKKTHSEVPGKFKAGGQCLIKSTLIQSSDGSILQIERLHNPKVVKTMIINDFSLSDSPITECWNVKKSKTYKIITHYPRLEIEASKDHLFFVQTTKGITEKAAEELQKGDLLIMPERIDIKGSFKTIPAIQYYNSFSINKVGRDLLKRKREKKGLLQRELAKQVGVTQTTVSSYEIGKLNAERISLQKICTALEIDFYDFLNKHTAPYMYKNIKLPVILDSKFAQFLGYLVGDGCFEKDRITFFEQNCQVALYYKQIYDRLFDIKSSYKFRESKNYHQLRFTSRPLVRLVLSEFPEIKKTHDTLIPKKILTSSNEVLAGFLQGLFDAEGYVSVRKEVALGINNKELARQIQMTLLRFGIIASLHEYDNRNNPYSKKHRFTIDITEKRSLDLFEKSIGFTSKEKSDKLRKAIVNKTEKSNVRKILVSGREIRKIVEDAGYNLQLFPKATNFFRNERLMSKNIFKNSILNCIKDEELHARLEKVYNCPFLSVKINRIEVREEDTEMVDISVGNQNFIANGIIVHNSAQRFARIREGAYKEHFKKIAEYMKEQFLPLGKDLKGIILGGPGTTVSSFLEKDYLTGDIKKKIIGTRDLSYTGEFGLQELVDRSQDLLAKEEIAEEKKVMQKFFDLLAKTPKKVSYGAKEVEKALEIGAVETLLLSEETSDKEIIRFEEMAKNTGAEIKLISTETREGQQLRDLGKIAAILRYELE